MAASMRAGEREKILQHLKDPRVSRIVITGESGMGKTFLAKEVVEEAIRNELCFETIWLSLNRPHQERSVYKAIARQLSVLPDYEECGVDELEEKDDEAMKKEIARKLQRKREIFVEMKFSYSEEKEFAEMKESGGGKLVGEKKSVVKKFHHDDENSDKEYGEMKFSEENAEKKLLDGAEKKFLEEKESGERKFLEDNESGDKKLLEGKKIAEDTGKKFQKGKYVKEKEYEDEETRSGEEKPPENFESREGKEIVEKKFLDDDVKKNLHKEHAEKKFLEEEEETVGKLFLLLILDDEGNKTDENQVMNKLGLRAFLREYGVQWKVLITRRTRDQSSAEKKSKEIELTGLSVEASQALFNSFLTEKVSAELGLRVTSIARKSNGLPAGIIVLAKSLSYLTQNGSKSLSPSLRTVFGEMGFLVDEKKEEEADLAERLVTGNDLLLPLSYQTLTSDVLVNCLWQSLEMFENSGGAYYRDLINHWILEGCFDPVKSIKTTYLEAYDVLMELLNRGMLKKQEHNMVVPEERMRNVFDVHHPSGFLGKRNLRLAELIDDGEQRDLEKTAQIDDMMKTITIKKVSTLLVSGTRLRREVPGKFLEKMPDLEVLGLFEPAFGSLTQSISELQKLRILVIRDCDLLESIDPIASVETLTALEISGVSVLKEDPDDDLFRKMAHLQSLNLSGLPVKFLPPSVSLLRELRYLILRHCPNLQTLPNLQFLENLEVIDTSGSTSLSNSEKKTDNINFFRLQNLQTLDFSYSKLIRLPLFQDTSLKWSRTHKSLTRLVLRECVKLSRLPSLKPLSSLEVLDLSGCVSIYGIRDQCFEEKKKLKTLNLSRTKISDLPSTLKELSSLGEMNLRGCCSLKSLPDLEGLTSLEVLDASGCTELTEITGSFKFMSRLEKLDLSGTKVTSLPAFPKANRLCSLLLKGCCSLKSFPALEEDFPMPKVLENLKVLNVSGCQELKNLPELTDCRKLELIDCSGCRALEINEQSFRSMPCLQKLDLSETMIKRITDIPENCSELRHLLLKNCTNLEDLKGIERFPQLQELNLHGVKCLNGGKAVFLQDLTELKSLNLSEIHLSELSSISKLTNLCNCSLTVNPEVAVPEFLSPLKLFKHLEVLSLSGTTITAEVLKKAPELICVKCLALPELNTLQELNWTNFQGSVKEISFEDHCFSVPVETAAANTKPIVLVTGTKLLQLEKDKPGDLQKLRFEGFNLSVCLKEQCNMNSTCCPRELHGCNKIIRGFSYLDQDEACLEIHGCDGSGGFSGLINKWLSQAEFISFIDNLSTTCSSIFSASKVKAAKGCLVERCMKMENLFRGEDGEAAALHIQQLETLHVSNLPNLANICSSNKNLQINMLQNLKKLTLECCSKMETTVFQASQIPKALEILQIKFCDKLKKVFNGKECELSRLQTLILFSLPELSCIGAKLPKLKVLSVKKCPNLTETEENLRGQSVS